MFDSGLSEVEPPAAVNSLASADASLLSRPTGFAATFRSLQHRNYRLYFFGQMVSLIGSWMQTTALMWLAFELTRKNQWPSLIAASQLIPTFFLGAWGGALADRFPKRSLILLTQGLFLGLALLLAILDFGGWLSPWQLLVISIATGLVQAVDLPARLAFVMDMVSRDYVINAVALNSVLFNLARAVGPALAGWMLIGLGSGMCFLINALSYVAVLWALWQMNVANCSAPPKIHARGSLAAGLRFLAVQPALAMLVVLGGTLAFCGWPALSLLPGLSQRTLEVRESGYSWMLSATGLGALLAALTVATIGTLDRYRIIIAAGVAFLSLGLLGLSAAHGLLLALLCCLLIGFGLILFFATGQAVVQLSTSDHNRGLIMGIWAMLLSGAVPLGNLLAGPAADRWGEQPVIRAQGWICAGACLLLVLFMPLGEHFTGFMKGFKKG